MPRTLAFAALVGGALLAAAALIVAFATRRRRRACRLLASPRRVPRIIHQTVRDRRTISPRLRDHIRDLRRRNPGWEHRLYDNADVDRIIRTRMPELYGAFLRIDPRFGPAVADFARYVVTYLDGGVYLDAKSGTSRPLDEIVRPDDTFACQSSRRFGPAWQLRGEIRYNGGYELMQWFIVAAPRHPLLRAVLETVARNIRDPAYQDARGKMGVLRITGPVAYSETIYPLLPAFAHRRLSPGDQSFVYSVLGDEYWREYDEELPRHYLHDTGRVLRAVAQPILGLEAGRLAVKIPD